ncbi:MAG: arsenate reductase (glutaredoxin) [Flavobacteriaceae bacterium]|nr:arsenate reductase (glutaredoxin) [Flavobacteriaceae bacterium]
MMKIYHNSRCRKSREALEILKTKNIEFEIIEYLKDNLTRNQLKDLIKKLGIEPINLVRKNEQIWKENFKNKKLTSDEIIQILSDNPKLIERPIVELNDKAIIGRPPENIINLLQ